MKKKTFKCYVSLILGGMMLLSTFPKTGLAATTNGDAEVTTNTTPIKEWDQVFGGSGRDSFSSVIQTADGGYVAAGFTDSTTTGEISDTYNGGSLDGLIVKFDSLGNRMWDQVFGGFGEDMFSSIIQTADGGYVAVGYTESFETGEISDTHNGGGADGLLVKFDSTGKRIWDQVFGGSGRDSFSSVIQTADGGYVTSGYTNSSATGEISDTSNGLDDGLLVKFDYEGNKEWDQVFGGSGFEQLYSVIQTADGEYVAVGFTDSSATGEISGTNRGYDDGLLVKFDSSGNLVWDQVFGGSEYDLFWSVINTSDGGYVATGRTKSSETGDIIDINNGLSDGLLVKFDYYGNKIWDQVCGGSGVEEFHSVILTSDGGYVVAGFSDSLPKGEISDTTNGGQDGLLVKFDSYGNKIFDQVFGGTDQDLFFSVIYSLDGGYVAAGMTYSSATGELSDTNNGGWGDGLLVKFNQPNPPMLTTQPTDQTVTEEQSVIFTAIASGIPTPTVQWQISTDDGNTWNDISGETSTTLRFTTSVSDNGKKFKAIFTNSFGTATSDVARLTVNLLEMEPRITYQPKDCAVIEGLTATFSAAATGNPAPYIQWQVSNDGGGSWNDIPGASSPTISLTTVLNDNGNQYRIVFFNSLGSVISNAATLSVHDINTYNEINFLPTKAWDQLLGGLRIDGYNSVVRTSDGGYVVAGYTESSANGELSDTNNGYDDGLLVKFDSSGTRVWDQVFGGIGQEQFTEVIQTVDGGYLAVGSSDSSESGEISDINNGYYDGLLVKFDSEGHRVWDQLFGGLNYDSFKSVIQIADGGYVVAGVSTSSASGEIYDKNNGDVDGLLVKFDSSGNREWDQLFGGSNSEELSSIQQTTDGGYVAVGFTESSPSGEIIDIKNSNDLSIDGLMVKFDSEGNRVWDQVFGGLNHDGFTSVIQVADGGYVVTGMSTSSASGEIYDKNNGDVDGLLVKFDSSGNREWDQLFGGSNRDELASVMQTIDGGFVAVGFTESSASGEITDINNGQMDGLLVKLDESGYWVWDQVYGGTGIDYFTDVAQTTDLGYVVAGSFISWEFGEVSDTNNGDGDGILVEFALSKHPQVLTQPTDQTVTEWQTVTFTSEASGTPVPIVQWQVSRDAGITWIDILGATSTTLSFITTLNDSGNQYRAVYTNSIGSVISDVAILLVNKKTTSVVTVSSNNLDWGIVTGGGEYIIGEIVKVTAIANYGFSFIGWQENGAMVSASSTYRFKIGIQDRELIAIFQPSWPKDIKLYGTSLSENSVVLSLSKPIVGATGYAIYYGENRIEKIASEEINWIIEGLKIAKNYTFTVQAIYDEGIETINGPSVTIRMKR